jgi:hypothetical protein
MDIKRTLCTQKGQHGGGGGGNGGEVVILSFQNWSIC